MLVLANFWSTGETQYLKIIEYILLIVTLFGGDDLLLITIKCK